MGMDYSKLENYMRKMIIFEFCKMWDQADFCSFISLEAVLQQRHQIQIWSWILPNLISIYFFHISPQPDELQSPAKTPMIDFFM